MSTSTLVRDSHGRFISPNKKVNNPKAVKKSPTKTKEPLLITHIGLVIDDSGSMSGKPTVRVVDDLIKKFAETDKNNKNQKTLVSIFSFSEPHLIKTQCLDVEAENIASINNWYTAGGSSTALTDATIFSVNELSKIKDNDGNNHAYLMYVITDGEENSSRNGVNVAAGRIQTELQNNDNWTVAFLVPNNWSKSKVVSAYGLSSGNVEIWDTTSAKGMEEMGRAVASTYSMYSSARASGARSVNNLFKLDTSKLTRRALTPVDKSEYDLITIDRDKNVTEVYKDYFGKKAWFQAGKIFYQPTKKVKIQSYKKIYVQDIKSGKVYEGGDLRELLGLPAQSVEVNPNDFSNGWRIFVQSTSNNRNMFAGTRALIALK